MTKTEQVKVYIRRLRRKYSYPYMERSLELPFGSFKKWWQGKFHSADIVLRRTLYNQPWLIEVAEQRYDPRYAQLDWFKLRSRGNDELSFQHSS